LNKLGLCITRELKTTERTTIGIFLRVINDFWRDEGEEDRKNLGFLCGIRPIFREGGEV
jgi:hypothetical protein